jgi:hypothetical protein
MSSVAVELPGADDSAGLAEYADAVVSIVGSDTRPAPNSSS